MTVYSIHQFGTVYLALTPEAFVGELDSDLAEQNEWLGLDDYQKSVLNAGEMLVVYDA